MIIVKLTKKGATIEFNGNKKVELMDRVFKFLASDFGRASLWSIKIEEYNQ